MAIIGPAWDGGIEIRQRGSGRVLSGRFPYGQTATRRDRGRRRKERFAPGSLDFAVREWDRVNEQLSAALGRNAPESEIAELRQALDRTDTHILRGHDFNQSLGSRSGGQARVSVTPEAVHFEVDLPDPAEMSTAVRDAVLEVEQGILRGVSPGFRVPPRSVVPDAEIDLPEPGNPGVTIRQINQAVLFELSLVARPAYSETDVEVRADDLDGAADAREVLTWL